MELVGRYFGHNPKYLSQGRIRSHIVHLKEQRRWSASSLRQAISSCRMFYCDMLGKSWKLWRIDWYRGVCDDTSTQRSGE